MAPESVTDKILPSPLRDWELILLHPHCYPALYMIATLHHGAQQIEETTMSNNCSWMQHSPLGQDEAKNPDHT
jgi:hypothetical protein